MPQDVNPPEHDNHASETLTGHYAPLSFDLDEFRPLIQGEGLTPEQEDEFLETLWKIVVTFVDLGFGIEATQLVIAAHFAECFENENGEDGDL